MMWLQLGHSLLGLLIHFCLLRSNEPETFLIFEAILWLSIIQDVLQILFADIKRGEYRKLALQLYQHHLNFNPYTCIYRRQFQNKKNGAGHKKGISSLDRSSQ
jgi:hypothetical protein